MHDTLEAPTHTKPKNQYSQKSSEEADNSQEARILQVHADRWHINELDKAIVNISRKIDSATYELLVLLREFDERGGWKSWGATSCAHWLAWRCDLSLCAAREKMRVAHALKNLPEISASCSSGCLSYSKTRAITRIATAENEAELLKLSARMTAAQLEEYCRQRKNVSAGAAVLARSVQQSRLLKSWRDEDNHKMVFSIELPLEEGLLVEKALDKAAQAHVDSSPDTPDKESSWFELQADALVAIAREYLVGHSSAETSTPQSTADHYQVMVHVDEAALREDNASKEGSGRSQLPIETIRRLCCDGNLIPVVRGAEGEVLNVGRKQRVVTTAIRRALLARDGGCAFPGCSHTRFLDAHHIEHWADNGETSLDNTVLLCGAHHKMVHEGGYTISKADDSRPIFTRPDGGVVMPSGYQKDSVREAVGAWQVDSGRIDSSLQPTQMIGFNPHISALGSCSCSDHCTDRYP